MFTEANKASDFLASLALHHNRGLHVLDVPPAALSPCHDDDASGVAWASRISIAFPS